MAPAARSPSPLFVVRLFLCEALSGGHRRMSMFEFWRMCGAYPDHSLQNSGRGAASAGF